MSEKTENFFEKMQEFLPSAKEAYSESIKECGEVLETVVIEDKNAKQYMGTKTTVLQTKADEELGRA